MNQSPAFITVVGASAGGVSALKQLIPQLRIDLNMSVFIVLHLAGNNGAGWLQRQLQQLTRYTVKEAVDNEAIAVNCIYIAPPGRHLLIKKGELVMGHGPEENGWKPAIDVLFRSAAAVYNQYVTGIILTGLLNDGVAGMNAIKRSGGVCIVQNPEEAEYPDMPLAVLQQVEVDYCVPIAEMAAVLEAVIRRPMPDPQSAPDDVIAEAGIAEKMVTNTSLVNKLGEPDIVTCPDCGGTLWHIMDGKISRYRCQTGHAYTEQELMSKQLTALQNTLWVSLRMMEQRKSLLVKLARESRQKGRLHSAVDFEQQAEEMDVHISRLKEILFTS